MYREGTLLIDGIDVTQLDPDKLRAQIAVVPQKALLFSGTIAENLRWGKENASMEELQRAAEMACADSFVRSFPDGYETSLGQGGVNLSGRPEAKAFSGACAAEKSPYSHSGRLYQRPGCHHGSGCVEYAAKPVCTDDCPPYQPADFHRHAHGSDPMYGRRPCYGLRNPQGASGKLSCLSGCLCIADWRCAA